MVKGDGGLWALFRTVSTSNMVTNIIHTRSLERLLTKQTEIITDGMQATLRTWHQHDLITP